MKLFLSLSVYMIYVVKRKMDKSGGGTKQCAPSLVMPKEVLVGGFPYTKFCLVRHNSDLYKAI